MLVHIYAEGSLTSWLEEMVSTAAIVKTFKVQTGKLT